MTWTLGSGPKVAGESRSPCASPVVTPFVSSRREAGRRDKLVPAFAEPRLLETDWLRTLEELERAAAAGKG